MGRAAELLGLRIDELWSLMSQFGIKHSVLDEENIERTRYLYKNLYEKIVSNIVICSPIKAAGSC